jgi:hypothetical protein
VHELACQAGIDLPEILGKVATIEETRRDDPAPAPDTDTAATAASDVERAAKDRAS